MKAIKNLTFLVFLTATLLPFCGLGQEISCQKLKNAVNTATLYYSAENLRSDTIDILKRLGLLDFHLKTGEDNKTYLEFIWIKNKLPS